MIRLLEPLWRRVIAGDGADIELAVAVEDGRVDEDQPPLLIEQDVMLPDLAVEKDRSAIDRAQQLRETVEKPFDHGRLLRGEVAALEADRERAPQPFLSVKADPSPRRRSRVGRHGGPVLPAVELGRDPEKVVILEPIALGAEGEACPVNGGKLLA